MIEWKKGYAAKYFYYERVWAGPMLLEVWKEDDNSNLFWGDVCFKKITIQASTAAKAKAALRRKLRSYIAKMVKELETDA